MTHSSNYNEIIEKGQGEETANWKVCVNCGESLEKKETNIKCIDWYWHCPKCNIIINKDIDQLYQCCRCGKIIEKNEELVFEFITPNWKELSFCNKPTGTGQYLCGKCHYRAIKPIRLKKLRSMPLLIPLFFVLALRPKS